MVGKPEVIRARPASQWEAARMTSVPIYGLRASGMTVLPFSVWANSDFLSDFMRIDARRTWNASKFEHDEISL
mgnify:CR=1 FL=1